jgi:hypothetical protein
LGLGFRRNPRLFHPQILPHLPVLLDQIKLVQIKL